MLTLYRERPLENRRKIRTCLVSSINPTIIIFITFISFARLTTRVCEENAIRVLNQDIQIFVLQILIRYRRCERYHGRLRMSGRKGCGKVSGQRNDVLISSGGPFDRLYSIESHIFKRDRCVYRTIPGEHPCHSLCETTSVCDELITVRSIDRRCKGLLLLLSKRDIRVNCKSCLS